MCITNGFAFNSNELEMNCHFLVVWFIYLDSFHIESCSRKTATGYIKVKKKEELQYTSHRNSSIIKLKFPFNTRNVALFDEKVCLWKAAITFYLSEMTGKTTAARAACNFSVTSIKFSLQMVFPLEHFRLLFTQRHTGWKVWFNTELTWMLF